MSLMTSAPVSTKEEGEASGFVAGITDDDDDGSWFSHPDVES